MGNPYWIKHLINHTFEQRFFLSKLSKIPGVGRLIEYMLFEDDDIFYLPKDNTIRIDQNVEQENLMIPSVVVDHFIKTSNYRFIMDFCICRDSTRCKDYPVELGCLFLGEAVKGINPKFGKMVSKEEAFAHVGKCRQAGLVHLVGRNKLDTVWLNVSPGEKLLTVCNCCPCCCLWKILPDINSRISAKVRRMPGVSVTVTDKCVGCGLCTKGICFVNAICLEDGQAVISDRCRGCGRCVETCPKSAIKIDFDPGLSVDLSIRILSELVDVS